MRALLLALMLVACATPVQPPRAVDAMAPLMGCWRGAFEGQAAIHDERCFEALGDGHVVDTHAVRPTEYAGETTYHYDDAAHQIVFAYAANDGGRSNGAMHVIDGGFDFPPHTYRGPDGVEQRLRSRWVLEDGDRFVTVSEREEGGVWRPLMRITYERVRS
jgi:hypothetical protein